MGLFQAVCGSEPMKPLRLFIPLFTSAKRRGSSNMWWIIIGAVIALVVMIVLMVMFTGKSSKVEGGLLDCESKGGICVAVEGDCVKLDGTRGTISSAFDCTNSRINPTGMCCFRGSQE